MKKKTAWQKELEKGDGLARKGKYEKALKHYRQALKENPEEPLVYDRLIETHQKIKQDWSEEDFTESLEWTMKKQELAHPRLKRVRAQMEPEWKEIMDEIKGMMVATDEESETRAVEKIAARGEKALYPLIEMLLTLKKFSKGTSK